MSYILLSLFTLPLLTSCEEVIDINLNTANPAFVVEGTIYKDSVCQVRLTQTTSYFSDEEPGVIDDAVITINDGTSSEELNYIGNGHYRGDAIIGTEFKTYEIEIVHGGKTYKGTSTMPLKTDITYVTFFKSVDQSIFNPDGDTVYTILQSFMDDSITDNYFMVRYIRNSKLLETRYFMLTENGSNGGGLEKLSNNYYNFSESIFCANGEVNVQLLTVDETTFNYFVQLDDVLFWKRRVMPPTPYNPVSNISNGALGYFAAWTLDSKIILLE